MASSLAAEQVHPGLTRAGLGFRSDQLTLDKGRNSLRPSTRLARLGRAELEGFDVALRASLADTDSMESLDLLATEAARRVHLDRVVVAHADLAEATP